MVETKVSRKAILFFLTSLMVFGGVKTASQNREGLFHPEKGHALSNHVINTLLVDDEIECGLQCLRTKLCKSVNYQYGGVQKHQCQLNNKSKGSASGGDYKADPASTYFEKDPCVPNPCSYAGVCSRVDGVNEFNCTCLPGYKGQLCESERTGWFSRKPGASCKAILDAGDALHDGSYWIDPGKQGKPLSVYCDMKTNGGGWILVSNMVIQSSAQSSQRDLTTSFRDISNYNNNHTLISSTNLRQLHQLIPFTQLRFQCRKSSVGRTLHVITDTNSTGTAALNFLISQTTTLPMACGSFIKGQGDNSRLAADCAKWGNDGSRQYVGKWGHHTRKNDWRLHDHVIFIAGKYHWVVSPNGYRCDANTASISPGDYWKIYVR